MGVSDDVAGERTSWNPRRHPINCAYPDFSWSASQWVQGGRTVMAYIQPPVRTCTRRRAPHPSPLAPHYHGRHTYYFGQRFTSIPGCQAKQ